MKFTLSWLKNHLETEKSLEEITDTLTAIGLEVENVDDRSAFSSFVIAKVLTAEKHPDADKLQVLNVDTGEGKPIQIVCGALNARADLIGVFAPLGAYVPGLDTTLVVRKIRGIKSFGMMCSERELLLSNEHKGIIDLPTDAPIGMPFAAYAGLDDPVIDINLTPNRSDCASVYGIARDLAAAGIGTLKEIGAPSIINQAEKTSVKIELEFNGAESLCLGFAWRVIKDIKNGPAPKWMQQRLTAIGLHPINALVDITNYLTFDLGRPLHVFDADKINSNLTVRPGRTGERLKALNGKEYVLSSRNCVVADVDGAISIAGIIGGEKTGCDQKTKNIIIESALWNPDSIARTGRELGIISDARYRFERGVDPDFMLPGLEFATQMVLDICGGKSTEAEVIGFEPSAMRKIQFPFSEIKRLTSLDMPEDKIRTILNNLGFKVAGKSKTVIVTVPRWRPDVSEKADLVEEIMRIYGVGRIEPQPLENDLTAQNRILTPLQINIRNARRALACRGMLEVITWSFISEKTAYIFGGGKPELKLANPIASDMSDMRPSLLPGLIKAIQRNVDLGFSDLAFFEVSDIYEGDTPEKQRCVAGGVRRHTEGLGGSGRFWNGNATAVDVFDVKADAITVLEACGIAGDKLQIESTAPSWYHPGRSGVIMLGLRVILGYFGELHPETLEALDIHSPLFGFEVFIDAVPTAEKKATRTRVPLVLSSFQKVTRDFAFVVNKNVTAARIIRAAAEADKKLIQSVQVFDLFEERNLGTTKKSIAIEVSIQPVERTLTNEDLEILSKKIIDNIIKTSGGYLRK
ncbi:MAG: phenylalanyl-tRNA synthetase beta chain [Candidatus Tokpelaia sp. JSC189]|nr:MAG: phenylalanyl-tRNA synthetase beta chain [Candidatus Tokpelaia sp. JSC189]